jgi:hypothetical protein
VALVVTRAWRRRNFCWKPEKILSEPSREAERQRSIRRDLILRNDSLLEDSNALEPRTSFFSNSKRSIIHQDIIALAAVALSLSLVTEKAIPQILVR